MMLEVGRSTNWIATNPTNNLNNQ